jgi:hypothetical protein
MTLRAIAVCLVSGGLLLACGGDDGKKVRQSCADDAACGGGVCFEQECYDACTETNPCADDEVCVRKARAGAEVDVCVVAADFFAELPGCVNAQPDCDALVAGVCQIVGCHGGACVVENKNDGIECETPDGGRDFCHAGFCGERTTPVACDSPEGVWTATITHPEEQFRASCVVDNTVTQVVTMTVTPDDAGGYAIEVETTNNVDPDTGECFTYTDQWPGGTFEPGTFTVTKQAEEQHDCGDGTTSITVTFGFEGTLNADCTQIVGTSWKEPADPCNPDSGRWEQSGVTFHKVGAHPMAAFR